MVIRKIFLFCFYFLHDLIHLPLILLTRLTERRLRKFLNIIHTGIPYAINQWEKDFQLIEIENLIGNYLQLGFNVYK